MPDTVLNFSHHENIVREASLSPFHKNGNKHSMICYSGSGIVFYLNTQSRDPPPKRTLSFLFLLLHVQSSIKSCGFSLHFSGFIISSLTLLFQNLYLCLTSEPPHQPTRFLARCPNSSSCLQS